MGKKAFIRSFLLSLVIISCVAAFCYGAVKSYNAINTTLYGRYEKALSIDKNGIRIFDFYISFK